MNKGRKVDPNLVEYSYPYAKKSFRNFVIAFLLLLIQMISLMVYINGSISIMVILLVPVVASFVLAILGFVYGVKSVREKEKSKWLKYIGLLGNLMLTSTLFTMLVYLLFAFIL